MANKMQEIRDNLSRPRLYEHADMLVDIEYLLKEIKHLRTVNVAAAEGYRAALEDAEKEITELRSEIKNLRTEIVAEEGRCEECEERQ